MKHVVIKTCLTTWKKCANLIEAYNKWTTMSCLSLQTILIQYSTMFFE